MRILFLLFIPPLCCLGQYEKMFPAFDGYNRPVEIKTYNSSTLYELINGAAENFLRFGFIELYTGDYTKGDDYITVEIYSMKNQMNSFGVYASERNPSAIFIPVGAEGYQVAGAVNFVYGPYYIKMYSNNPSDETTSHIVQLANTLTASFFACTSLPFELTGFPAEGRKDKSELYIPENFLGHSFLAPAFTCDYSVGNSTCKLFIMNLEHADRCKKTLCRYLAFAGIDTSNVTEKRYIFTDQYNGTVAVEWKSGLLFGVTGLTDEALINEMTDRLRRQMEEAHLF